MSTRKFEQYQDYLARLFPLTQDEIEDRKVRFGIQNPGLARTITFQVTDACNLACTYCYQINKANHSLDFETAKRYADMILQATSDDNEYINPDISTGLIIEFIGGEPFLEIDLIDKITDYIISEMFRLHHKWATRYRISICSNGVLYFDPRVQAYIKKHLSHLSFSISIDGNKELHDSCRVFPDGRGSYDTAIAGVKHFTEVLGGNMGSKMTLCPANIDKTYEAVISLIDTGYTDINLNCVYEEGWTIEHAKIMYEQLKQLADYVIDNDLFNKIYLSIFLQSGFKPKDPHDDQNWCGGTGSMLACDWRGSLYPCIRYMDSSLGSDADPITIGDVYSGLMKTAKDIDTVHHIQSTKRTDQSCDVCIECPIADGCAWCSGYNYQLFHTVHKRATYICITHQARALANIYFWNKGYRSKGESLRMKNNVPDEWALRIISQDELDMLNNLAADDT